MPPSNYRHATFAPTGDEADRRDRHVAEAIVEDRYTGYKLCRGYPSEHFCMAMIPYAKWPPLCHGCLRTQALDMASIRAHHVVLPSAGEVLEDLQGTFAVVKACACGGDAEAPYHEQSLTHLSYSK